MDDKTHIRMDGPPDAPPLVLVHGVGLDLTMWDLVINDLTEHYRVTRYDLLGHGRSADPSGPRTIDDFVDQLLDVMRSAGNQPAVAGLSIGGLITMAAAARHPSRFGQVAALNTVFGLSAQDRSGARERLALAAERGLEPIANLAVDRWFSAAWQAEHPDRLQAVHDRLTATDLSAYLKAYAVFVDGDPMMPDAASAIGCPVFAMTGELDPGSTPAMTHAIACAVTRGTSHILPDLHHLPCVEDPSVFAAALLEGLSTSTVTAKGTTS